MSRVGNRILTIPEGVEVSLDGNKITTKGQKGTLEFRFRNEVIDVKVGTCINSRKPCQKIKC